MALLEEMNLIKIYLDIMECHLKGYIFYLWLLMLMSLNFQLRKRNDVFTFLYVGRFIKRKQIIIEEFLSKYNNNPSVQLVLVGDGECYDDIHNKYPNTIIFCLKVD